LDVVATDASAGMVRRTQELADEHSVPLQALRVAWDDLPDYLDPSTFDLVTRPLKCPMRVALANA
jgi:hypothetical protein